MFADFDWVQALRTSPILMVLVACSVVTLAVALERALYFRRRGGDPDAALTKALTGLRQGRADEARWACTSLEHPAGAVCAEVFDHPESLPGPREERIEIALSRQKLLLERNLTVLGSMAAVAPLIGLLGTVWGIMRAFHDMALTGSSSPAVVAAGVSEALWTTAAGLVVAVPAVLLYNHFGRRMTVMLTVAENNARGLAAALSGEAAVEATGQKDVERIEKAVRREPQPATR
jgi:biopolymer transport protein ExbB